MTTQEIKQQIETNRSKAAKAKSVKSKCYYFDKIIALEKQLINFL